MYTDINRRLEIYIVASLFLLILLNSIDYLSARMHEANY